VDKRLAHKRALQFLVDMQGEGGPGRQCSEDRAVKARLAGQTGTANGVAAHAGVAPGPPSLHPSSTD
jgi:hypothetical protein